MVRVRMKWIAAGGAATAVAAAGLMLAVSGPTTAGAAAARTTPQCATSGLDVWLDTQGNGTAGAIVYRLELTNLSGHTCTIEGYPGISAVTLDGAQLGTAATRITSPAAHLVTLAEGRTASVDVQLTTTGVYAPHECVPVTAAGIRVYPPDQTASKVVPFPFAACSKAGPRYLGVYAAT